VVVDAWGTFDGNRAMGGKPALCRAEWRLVGGVIHDAAALVTTPWVKKDRINLVCDGERGDIGDDGLSLCQQLALGKIGVRHGNAHRIVVDPNARSLCGQCEQVATTATTKIDNLMGTGELKGSVLRDTLVTGLLEPATGKPQLMTIMELGDGLLAHCDELVESSRPLWGGLSAESSHAGEMVIGLYQLTERVGLGRL
jgi:hypothetical protein